MDVESVSGRVLRVHGYEHLRGPVVGGCLAQDPTKRVKESNQVCLSRSSSSRAPTMEVRVCVPKVVPTTSSELELDAIRPVRQVTEVAATTPQLLAQLPGADHRLSSFYPQARLRDRRRTGLHSRRPIGSARGNPWSPALATGGLPREWANAGQKTASLAYERTGARRVPCAAERKYKPQHWGAPP